MTIPDQFDTQVQRVLGYRSFGRCVIHRSLCACFCTSISNPMHCLLLYFFLNSVNAKVPLNLHNAKIELYPSIITETITSRTIISYFLLVANIGHGNNADKDYLVCKC